MSVVVVATAIAAPCKAQELLDVFRELVPLVHAERGCELYAAHREPGGDAVVVVESWSTQADLDDHAAGPVTARLMASLDGLIAGPPQVLALEPVPLGDESRGAIRPGSLAGS